MSLTIKKLRSDNRAEYTVNEFKEYLSKLGIVHQLTMPYSLQQNGVSERKNKTLIEMARCLLFEKKLPKFLWAKVVNTANYLLNLTSTRALVGKTSYEAWYDMKPSIKHLKVFGCICFAKVPDARRTKLDSKSMLAIPLGYSEASKENQLTEEEFELNSNDVDEMPVGGTKSLSDVYARCHVAISEPSSYVEAASDEHWKQAMEVEMNMIWNNKTWVLVDKLTDHNVLAFLNGYLKEDIYVEQPDGFVEKGSEAKMLKDFEMADLGLMTYFLGIEFIQSSNSIIIHQSKYAQNLWKKFHLDHCKAVKTPLAAGIKFCKQDGSTDANEKFYKSIIESLLYLAATRPNLMFATSLMSRYMQAPTTAHFIVAKRILRYVRGTVDYRVKYVRAESSELQGFFDNDWAGSQEDSKSTNGYCFSFGSGVFSWSSKKQETVAQSSAEAEYIATTSVTNQVL
ncbi:Integrase [Theobroma cacao]|nr:Integrase [Theobroma cacao]WRX15969.1 Integrase [Theobroma cacao]